MKKNLIVVRQGDMIFMKVDGTKLANSKKVEKITVGLGEVSGHAHDVLAQEGCTITEFADSESGFGNATRDRITFKVEGNPAIVTHEEHNPITLDEGVWTRINQINYDPFKDELEKVRD